MKKILTICSTLDFQNYTRRATIEAIAKKAKRLDILLYTGLKNQFTKKNTSQHLKTSTYHFWIPESLNKLPLLRTIESQLRKPFQKKSFETYDVIFFTDPNQYRLLPYVGDQKVVYLIRDPNILQSERHRIVEQHLLNRADLVLATSKNLAVKYLSKYYGFQHANIQYWPNCVDLSLWDVSAMDIKKAGKPTVGVAGNFSEKRTDYELLETLAKQLPDMQIEIAGKIDRDAQPEFWKRLLEKENVDYLGIIPLDELPKTVARWHVGLVTDRVDEYASYMHHNKVYQYLALGVPVVSMMIHKDYDGMDPCVMMVVTAEGFTTAVRRGIENGRSERFREQCRRLAGENSAEKRADSFFKFLNLKETVWGTTE